MYYICIINEILNTADYTGSTPCLDIGSEIQVHILDDPATYN